MRRIREQGHRVADFNTLDDLISHAQKEGATHVYKGHKTWGDPNEAYLYFPRGDGSYEEAGVYKERGYLHLTAQTSRGTVPQLPSVARPIKDPRWGRRTAETGREFRETDDSSLRQLPGSGPDFTNASINRNQAMRMMKAGMSPTEIAKAFPKVFSVDAEGRLGQKYDTIYIGSGRKETKYTILKSAVDEVIREFKRARPRGARSRPSEARRSAHHRSSR